MLIVRLQDVLEIQKISFFTETGYMIESPNKEKAKDCYVILAILQSEEALRKINSPVTANDVNLAKKFLKNEVVPSNKSYHYETTGIIHGFGYGPVYKLNERTKHSIEKFAKSKYPNIMVFSILILYYHTNLFYFSEPTYKNASEVDLENLKNFEKKLYHILNASLEMINNRFISMRNKISPKVAAIQSNVDFNPGNTDLENEVEMKGYLNFHLCINAQTNMAHTEPDASYTVIVVPNSIHEIQGEKNANKAKFEFIIDEEKILVIPMHAGLILTYSGYLLTHRQQIYVGNESSTPFMNIVAYNSKRLFSNLMESFRRDIQMDKKILTVNKNK